MSRKHYIAVAAIIAEEREESLVSADTLEALDRIAAALASEFKRDNGNFDRARFLDACGVER